MEVEDEIRSRLLDWALEPLAAVNDPRVLLVFPCSRPTLLAVAAHERQELETSGGGKFYARKLYVFAVRRSWQRKKLGGQRLSNLALSAALQDIENRDGAVPVFAYVHRKNARSITLCRRFGLTLELTHPHVDYRWLITPPARARRTPG